MQTNKRNFRVEIKTDDLVEVLIRLQEVCGNKVSGSLILNLNLDDTKETYKFLNSDPGILDWDFGAKEVVEEEEKPAKKKKEAKPTKEAAPEIKEDGANTTLQDILKIYPVGEPTSKNKIGEINDSLSLIDYVVPENTDGIIRVIEAVWNVAKNTPNIRFGTSLFIDQVLIYWSKINEEEYLKTDLNKSITRSMMKLLIDVFYNSPVMKEEVFSAYNDTLDRIKESFNSLKNAETLNQVMNILYRHEREKI